MDFDNIKLFFPFAISPSMQKEPPKVFIEIWQNSQENTCTRVSFFVKFSDKIHRKAPLPESLFL